MSCACDLFFFFLIICEIYIPIGTNYNTIARVAEASVGQKTNKNLKEAEIVSKYKILFMHV